MNLKRHVEINGAVAAGYQHAAKMHRELLQYRDSIDLHWPVLRTEPEQVLKLFRRASDDVAGVAIAVDYLDTARMEPGAQHGKMQDLWTGITCAVMGAAVALNTLKREIMRTGGNREAR